MRYLKIEVESKSGGEPSRWWRAARHLVSANPDLDALQSKARVWWVEVSETGAPLREIGFAADGHAVVLGPIGRNYGLAVDSPVDWSRSDGDSGEVAARFDEEWNTLWPRFKHLAGE